MNYFLLSKFVIITKQYIEYAPVAQLDRVSDSDSEGRAFESHRAYQKYPPPQGGGYFWLCWIGERTA